MSITTERLSSLIQRELAPIVNSTIQNEKIGYINLTEVRVTKDLKTAKIFYTILSDEEEILEITNNYLSKFNGTIRMELAKKIRNVRKIPELNFVYDEALAYGNHIDKLLKEIK